MKKEMLINVLQSEECRIAIVEDGVLEELYVERASQESYVGNIYKGRIVNIEPSIQAAFVDFGIGRNGFLHVSDVDPAYYKHLLSKEALAAYEEELEREHTGGRGGARGGRERDNRGGDRSGGRDRDRGPSRREPVQPTAWLEPQPAAPTEEDEGFTEGLDVAPVSDDLQTFHEDVDHTNGVSEGVETTGGFGDDVELANGFDDGVHESDEFSEVMIDGPFAEELPVAEAAEPAPNLPQAVGAPSKAPVEEDDEFADFGAGIGGDEPEPEPEAAPAVEAEDEEPKAKKPRAPRKPKAEGETEDKKPRARKPRKKAEGEPETGDDDKPRYMPSAEHRTSPPDDPELQPFFEGSDDFDINAPNDRFGDTPAPAAEAEDPGFELVEDDDAPENAAETVSDDELPFAPADEPEAEAMPITGRGFNDDFEDNRPPRPERNDRGGRGGPGRGRDRDDRGGPGRGRDRDDRGGRGGPSRDDRGGRGGPGRDRGPRTSGPPGGRDRGLPKPPIQEIFKRGQEVIVQVIKEGIGTKGPTLSTYISIAGRYLVLMPSLGRVGVSRKIEDHEARRRLREIMSTLAPPRGVGFIVRTAAVDRDAKELRNDLAYLLRLWQVVVKRIKRVAAPVEIYRESDMITRTIRDIFTADVDSIWVDEANAFAHASEFLQIVMPRYASRIRFFGDTEPLFHRYGIEDEIAKMHTKKLDLPGGGSIVIEQTEALVAIDVNSGNFRAENNAEETAYQMNLRAAREIARQLRLRDLGGVIVNDFIDMRSETHRRNVENALREAMERDRARTKILRISQFGLIEMTRQRIRPSLKRSIFSDCSHCRGTGFVKTNESMSIEVMRMVQLAAHRTPAIQTIEVTVNADVANYLLNKKRKELAKLEEQAKMAIQITGQQGVSPELCAFKCLDQNGNEVRLIPPAPVRLQGGRAPRGNPDRERRFPPNLD
jgi:ribonuclease E